jgi:hypothetical protein
MRTNKGPFPSRPATGFALFKESAKEAMPAGKGMCSIQKEVGAQWKAMPEEEKAKYKREAAPAWIQYFNVIGETAKARKLTNKLNGVMKRRRANLAVGGFIKKVDTNGKAYFHNETTGMASRTKVLLVDDLLTPKVKSGMKGMTGWLVFRSVNAKKFAPDFKENSKQAGAAWKALSDVEQEDFRKRAIVLNARSVNAAPADSVAAADVADAAAAHSDALDESAESSESESSESDEEDDI